MREWTRWFAGAGSWALCSVGVLLLGPAVMAQPDGMAAARAVVEGCRVREETACGFEFTAVAERFVGRRTLGSLIAGEPEGGGTVSPERADEILTLTTLGDAEGSRARFIEHHRVTADEWEMEARCTVWGGADRYFLADVRREYDEVADLHMKKLWRPEFEATYSTGPVYKCAMAEVTQPRTDWCNAAAPCADYLGLNLAALGPLSEVAGRWMDMAARVTAQPKAYDGQNGVELTIYVHAREGVWSTYRLGFIELGGYAPVSAELSSVVTRDDGTEGLLVTVCTWGDYARIPEGPWIPCTHRLGEYSTDSAGVLRLNRGANVAIDPETVGQAEGRLPDEDVARWCPRGTLIRLAPGIEDRLPRGVADSWTRYQAELWPEGAWHARRIDSLVLGMDAPLFTGDDAQRGKLAARLREQIKQAVEGTE